MRPEFGCRIYEHVFAPANATTAGQIAYDVRAALDRWEPRIDVDDVVVTLRRASTRGVLYIDISYRIRGTNDPRNLVFPFYVIPEHEPSQCRSGSADGRELTWSCPPPTSTTATSRTSSTTPSASSSSAARSGPTTTSPTRASR